jgi:tetratricopeptide (TPR) repeat protein
MISRPLQIRYGKRSLRETAAWFLPGSEARDWLDEIVRWDVPQAGLRLRVVPVSRQNLRPRGVLVTVPAGSTPNVSLRCLPYSKLAGRLFLPVEAWLDPDISEQELSRLLGPAEYVLHPATGLVGFEPGDLLRVADLLHASPASGRAWDRAHPGIGLARRLTALTPEEVPSVESVLEEGRGDIGSSAASLDELPPGPDEPKETGQGMRGILARMVKWLAGKAPATSDRPTWVDRVRNWAERQLTGRDDGLTSKRNRELRRLMRLLASDPDQGLKYALPMGGGAHRGRGAPGDRLVRRETNFDLGRLGGGQAADFWDVPADYQNQLIARYRELADREVRLGRHRRAAYIYAELLGDLNAAATALMAGHHWREAALLYKQRLSRPWDAARCLEQGGLWAEAIALYEELQAFEQAGDLHKKLEQPDDAAVMYRRAVERARASGDFLVAARLLDEKLGIVDEALEELAAGWPSSMQAAQCLRGVFRLLGRLGRHEAARGWIEDFHETKSARGQIPPQGEALLVDILTDTATGYPDRGVQGAAADCVRVLAAQRLAVAEPAEARQLLYAVGRLEPQDRLLGRDCHRYLQQRPATPGAGRRLGRRNSPTLVGRVQLDRDVSWSAATVDGDTIFAAGLREKELVVVRCRADGASQELPGTPWRLPMVPEEGSLLLVARTFRDNRLLVHGLGCSFGLGARAFPANDHFRSEMVVGWMPGISETTLGATRSEPGITWLVEVRNEHWTLVGLGPDAEPLTTRAIAPIVLAGPRPALPIPIQAREDRVHIGLGDRLLIYSMTTQKPDIVEIGEVITSLQGSAPGTRARLAATFRQGGLVFFEDCSPRGLAEPFATELADPVAGFMGSGDLVAASADGCAVYSTQDRCVTLKAEWSGRRAMPLAVLPLPRPDQFALFAEDGELTVYQVSPV